MAAAEHRPPAAAMVVTGTPSHSQHYNEAPKPTEPQESEQSPDSETLDTPKPPQSPLHDHGVHEPIVLTDDAKTPLLPPPQPPLASPTNSRRRPNKRKKGGGRNHVKHHHWITKKIQNLTNVLNPIPFIPKSLDLKKHEDVLKRLGLYQFSKIELDRSIRTDLLVQLIVNYDPKKRCSYVNDKRISVNRADLARALQLPGAKQDKGSRKVEVVDLDSEVIGFIEDFIFNWMLLHEESWVMPVELENWTRCIRDGHPEKLDSASLIWYKVERELTQGDKLVDCYYASHLQCLIRSQHHQLLREDDNDDGGSGGGGGGGDDDDGEEHVKVDEEQEEKGSVVQDDDVEVTLGSDVEKIVHQEVRKDDETMVDAEECKETALAEKEAAVEEGEMEEQVNWKHVSGEHILQRCQSTDLNDYEELKVEGVEVEDEQIEQVQDEDDEPAEEEGAGVRFVAGFDMEMNDGTMDRDGLTDNFAYGSHAVSSMDMFRSTDDSFMSHAGPSFFNHGGKRVMESEEHMHDLDGNSKRLKTNEIWDQKQDDFGFCMVQMQQWMEKAKMIHDSKQESYINSKNHQDLAMAELQERDQLMEMIIKSKDEELEKKHVEVFRLERELYLMGDLLAGYRKALDDTRSKFCEYRRRVVLQEQPLYKDAGPGGLVLSTHELEKQRLKREEYMKKFQTLLKSFEEQCVYQLEIQDSRALKMAERLVFVWNEVERLKERATQCKETNKANASMESVPPDAKESKEKVGGEEH